MQNTLKIDVRYQVMSFPCIITVITEITGWVEYKECIGQMTNFPQESRWKISTVKNTSKRVCVGEWGQTANWIFQKQDVAVWPGIKLSPSVAVAGSSEQLYFSSILPLLLAADILWKFWAHLTIGNEFCLSKHVKWNTIKWHWTYYIRACLIVKRAGIV